MLIFDNNNRPLILDDIYTPTISDHFWVLDLQIMDFTLTQLMVLEEIISPTIMLRILGFEFTLPANWNILIVDPETQMLDVIELKDVAGKEFRALIFGPNKARHEQALISVVDYFPNKLNVGPSLFKHQMLCHPVAPDTWINVAPSDGYNKYLKDAVAGDII
jgi:hypothetical protein